MNFPKRTRYERAIEMAQRINKSTQAFMFEIEKNTILSPEEKAKVKQELLKGIV